jgi:uracil-DNA glycosylase
VEDIATLESEIVRCRACPRLVAWREQVGREKRKSFRNDTYWARPIPSFGDEPAPILIVGLAPAAHGANRTGRVFTGDRSADFLVAGMHRAGLASQPTSDAIDDGLRLIGCRMTAAVRCAPPQNAPTPAERTACRPYLIRELALLRPRVILALGGLAWQETLRAVTPPRPWPRFGHGAEAALDGVTLVGCYHPSQQNTFTGRLTATMLDDVLQRAVAIAR